MLEGPRFGRYRSRRHARQQPLRGHWLILAVWVTALTAALVLYGYAHHMLRATADGAAATARPAAQVPSEATSGKPVLDITDAGIRSVGPADRTVALTFDDGPNPEWTPRILDVLKENGSHATFFVVGSRAAQHPDVLRRIHLEGHEIGIHTFTHEDLGSVSAWRGHLELRLSQLTVAGATNTAAPLLRLPYSSSNADLDDASWKALQLAGHHGYVTVLSTIDSQDWRRPGVAQIVARSTPKGDAGQVLLLHDGGGDRSQTVAALRELLPNLQAKGLQVQTVSDAVGLSQRAGSADALDHWQGRALIFAVQTSDVVVRVLGWLLLMAGLLSVVRAAVVAFAARRHRRRRGRRRCWTPPITGPVSVIVPAFNERAGIQATVRSLMASDHPIEVVVVDDGSADGTADLVDHLGLAGVTVVRQANAGKPAALNAGLAASAHELVVMVDADTVVESDAVRLLVQPFADPRVGAVSGNAKVANRGNILGCWQHIEYVVGFNLDRRLFDLACPPCRELSVRSAAPRWSG